MLRIMTLNTNWWLLLKITLNKGVYILGKYLSIALLKSVLYTFFVS